MNALSQNEFAVKVDGDFFLAVPGDLGGAMTLTLDKREGGKLRRRLLAGDAAMRAWKLLTSAIEGEA